MECNIPVRGFPKPKLNKDNDVDHYTKLGDGNIFKVIRVISNHFF